MQDHLPSNVAPEYFVITNHDDRTLIGKIAYPLYSNRNGDIVAFLWSKKVGESERNVIVKSDNMKSFPSLNDAMDFVARFKPMR